MLEIYAVCVELANRKYCAWFSCAGATPKQRAAAGVVLSQGLGTMTAVQTHGLQAVKAARRELVLRPETSVSKGGGGILHATPLPINHMHDNRCKLF